MVAQAVYDVRRLNRLDVDSDEAATEFMEQACSALRDYRKKGWEVYACIAGGCKAMSALLAIAVQFYGAQRLFHVLVAFVERVVDIGWREGQPKVKNEDPNMLIVYLPGRRMRGIGFRLTTTARTRGQLASAQRAVERWIEGEVQ